MEIFLEWILLDIYLKLDNKSVLQVFLALPVNPQV